MTRSRTTPYTHAHRNRVVNTQGLTLETEEPQRRASFLRPMPWAWLGGLGSRWVAGDKNSLFADKVLEVFIVPNDPILFSLFWDRLFCRDPFTQKEFFERSAARAEAFIEK